MSVEVWRDYVGRGTLAANEDLKEFEGGAGVGIWLSSISKPYSAILWSP